MLEVVILIAIPELTKAEFATLLPKVSPEKQERIKQFHFFRDASNTLLGDILARLKICCSTGLSNKQLIFATNEFGKPYLINSPHVHYNISHAGHYIACVTDDEPVGIDIELIKPINLRIAERFFTPDETAYIRGSQQMPRFYEVWTKKESRIKWEGKGLYKSLLSFSVINPTQSEKNIVYHKVFQNNETVCHVCSSKHDKPAVQVINIADLIWQVGRLPTSRRCNNNQFIFK